MAAELFLKCENLVNFCRNCVTHNAINGNTFEM